MSTPTLSPGDVVDGRYVVEEELGRGGYGVVWRVRHLRLDAARALKVLHDPDPAVAERLRAEGQVLAKLSHPHVVRVHDLVDLPSGLGLVMELVDGPTLAERLAEGPLPMEEVLHIGRGLLQGLQEAHRRGVLHRDLKPANVLLDRDADGWVPKWVDFGLAVTGEPTQREAAGTPAYMAPEQLEGRYDEASDVFGLATVLYELATGQRAFAARSLSQLMMAKAEGRVEPPRSVRPELPAGLSRMLMQALSPRPEARPPLGALLGAWRPPSESMASLPAEVPHFGAVDLSSLGDSRATDRALLRRLPTPVAAAWQGVVAAPSDRARSEALSELRRQLFAWLVATGRAELHGRRAEALGSVQGEGAPALWRLMEVGGADGEVPWVTLAPGDALHEALARFAEGPMEVARTPEARALLVSLRLDALRLFVCLAEREGALRRVQVYMGQSPGEAADTVFSPQLQPGRAYLLLPGGDRALCLSPWVQVDGGVLRVDGARAADETQTRWVTGHDPDGVLSVGDGTSTSGLVVGGRFELRSVLGTGGMSTVHRAHDRLTDEEVALKLLAADFATDPEFRERFKREAQRMRQLDHPHVLCDVELGSLDSGQLWLRMPILDGGTLRERIASGPLPADTARRFTEELLSALVALAEAGVVHRDIKPSNLLLDGDDRLMLVDFGVALSEDDARLTRTLQQLGSLAYLAPECRGSGEASHKSDVYSAALVIHELHTGRAAGALPGKGIDSALGAWLRHMGAVDPDERPTAAEVLEALRGEAASDAEVEPSTAGALDRRVLALGVPLGALGGVLLALPAWNAVPRLLAPEFVPRGMLVPWLGEPPVVWVLASLSPLSALGAGLLLPGARRHGAAAGAIAAMVAFGVGGVLLAVLWGTLPLHEVLGRRVASVPQVLGDAVVRLSWLMLGAWLLCTAVGAALGALGAHVRSGDGEPSAPDPVLRQLAGAGLVVVTATTSVAWPALDSMLQTVRSSAGSAVGLDVTLGVASLLATVPWLLGQAVGGGLCASPWLPPHRGETALRGLVLALVVGVQAMMVPFTGPVPPLLTALVLLGVLAWRRPWRAEVLTEGPPRDLMAVAAAGLAAIAVVSAALPLAQLGLAMESSLGWSLAALEGRVDPVPAADRLAAQLQGHFAFTRLLLAGSALGAVTLATLLLAATGLLDAARGRLARPREVATAVVGGMLVVGMMGMGTGHDWLETRTADPRPPLPEGPPGLDEGVWREWAAGDLLHGLPPGGEGDEQLVAATVRHLQGRPHGLGDEGDRHRVLARALDGDPAPLHAWLDRHDDPLLASLHHGVGAVPWGDDPHEALSPTLPVERWLAVRRAASGGRAVEGLLAQAAAGSSASVAALEAAWHRPPGEAVPELPALDEVARSRRDGAVARWVHAVLAQRRDVETAARQELLGAGELHDLERLQVVEALVATGRLREARDLALEPGASPELQATAAWMLRVSGAPQLAAELQGTAERVGGPCDGLVEVDEEALDDALARLEAGRCPPGPRSEWLVAVLRGRRLAAGDLDDRGWVERRWVGSDRLPGPNAASPGVP